MTDNKTNTAKTAEKITEATQKMSNNEEAGTDTAVSTEQPQNALPESIDQILNKISPEKLAMAEKFGLPLGELITYLRINEKKIEYIVNNIPDKGEIDKLNTSLSKLSKLTTAPQTQAGGGGNMFAQFLPMLAQMGLSGGGENELAKQLMNMQLDRMKVDMAFTDAIKNALVSRLTSKAVDKVADI